MGHVIALSGGVGGAKLACGLARVLAPEDLTLVVNTGDDFDHLGLRVCPDIDSVAYAMAGLSDRERGWGLAGETWGFMTALKRLGGTDWFNLGDHDLAMHVERTRRLAAGQTLSQATADLTRALGLRHTIVPMSDDPVRTFVETDAGRLAFQEYFVRERCAPRVRSLDYVGAETARPASALMAALARPDLDAIVICPSNPYLSVDPILALPGVTEAIRRAHAPCVAVSPIVGGQALKGPAAKLMAELGAQASGLGIAAHYRGLIDGLVIDSRDAAEAAALEGQGLAVLAVPSVMITDEDRARLARDCLGFARRLAPAEAL
ncbi:MAG: LPPG:Fo 2-phospho-L-lactate transferase [Caulobacteraceae bacterium]|nr:LPPG:Fo 2-phospho-L-lactate transferase [Caulobacteraceae bacterium]